MTELSPLWQQAVDEGRVEQSMAEHLSAHFPNEENQTCSICGKLIVPNVEAHYGASDDPRHYTCHREKYGPGALERWKDEKARFDTAYAKAMDAIGALRGVMGSEDRQTQKERDFDRQRFDSGPTSGPVKR